MKYKTPVIKVTWEDVSENFTEEKVKRIKTYFQHKYGSRNVQIVPKHIINTDDTKLKSLEVSDSITDHQFQKKLMKDFIEENKINIKWDMIDRLDNKVNVAIDLLNENKVRYNKWYIKRIEFSNFLSYGNNNVIDFTEMEGITCVESSPRNFGGKSTISIDLLMFLFFNTTTKTKTNIEIFNRFSDENELSVKGEITIDNEDYFIERILTRKKSRSGDYTVTNKLEFYKKNSDGTITNLSGEQRRETEEFIESAIGTQEDFLSTILTTGYNLEELIESKPTARGQILTKFLGLEALKLKEDNCKEIYNEWCKKLVSNTYNLTQLENDNTLCRNTIIESENEIIKLTDSLGEFNIRLRGLEEKRETALRLRNNNIDQELIKVNPKVLLKEINDLKRQKQVTLDSANEISVVEPSEYYYEDKHEGVKKVISDFNFDIKVTRNDIEKNLKLIKELEEGSICPTCKRSLEEVDHTDEINDLKYEIKDCESHISEVETSLKFRVEEDEKLNLLKKEYDEYEKNKLRRTRHELEAEQKQLDIDKKQVKLDNFESNKKKLEENQKIDNEVITLKTLIETTNGDIRQTNGFIEKHKNQITNMGEKIKVNDDLVKKIKSEEELVQVFKTYLTIYGKNGISKIILKNMIPLLNQELSRLLTDSCHFMLELNINEKNEVEFLMIDNESRVVKPLNSGSGYEKTISSLALRSVLTKISSLPKPNIVVMDEVFGKVADENLEMVGEFFKKIRNYFEHIFVISHNTLIRNWSDNLIMIKKEENISSIDYITKKIS